MPSKIPTALGLALTNLLKKKGWTGKELAGAAHCSPSTISAYEAGDGLTRERLEELAGVMGFEPEEVELAVLAASLLLPTAGSGSPVEPTAEQLRIIMKSVAMGGAGTMEALLQTLVPEVRRENAKRDLEAARETARELKRYSEADRRVLVADAPEFQTWGLAVVLCGDSEAAAPDKPDQALKLAQLAVLVAQNVPPGAPGGEPFRIRLEGWCEGFLGNAERVCSRLPASEAAFARSWRLWEAGEDPDGLLSKARLLDLEASLRRAQREFDLALERHREALAAARPEEVGHLLLNKSATLEEKNDYEGSIEVLAEAARVIDGDRQPRLRCILRFNEAAALIRLGRAAEAAPLVEEVRSLAERLRNEIDLLRSRWLAANCAAGLGRRAEALVTLTAVRSAFAAIPLPYDCALATLDLSLLYRQEGRFAEITVLAGEMVEIFEAQRVHREAIGAAMLFREAAEREEVTVELVRRLQDYLSKATRNPDLRFLA